MSTDSTTIEAPQRPLNWRVIIEEIESDMTILALASLVGCTKETIYALKRVTDSGTQEPRHALGARILSVHRRVLAKQRAKQRRQEERDQARRMSR